MDERDRVSVRPFATLPVIDGYEVVAHDTGRAVAHRATAQSANGVAHVLNDAAALGPRALLRTFKSVAAEEQPQQPHPHTEAVDYDRTFDLDPIIY